MFYLIVKSIHLLCACIVIGYLVYDVFVFSLLKKGRSEAEFIKLKRELLRASALILGASFLFLLLSGGILASFYLNIEALTWENFFLQNHIQKMIWLKIALVLLLLLCTLFSFYFILVLKKPDPFRRFYHHLALVICLFALIVAKIFML